MNKIVFIGEGAFQNQVEGMFLNRGWAVVSEEGLADFLCLPGGADISPRLYEEYPLAHTHSSIRADEADYELFRIFKDRPKLGICRGGQFLNVLSGGKMWQHVDNHNSTHLATDVRTGNPFEVSSLHHQSMILSDKAVLIAVSRVSTERFAWGKQQTARKTGNLLDIEAAWYPHTKSLCYQPHPELGPDSCTDFFFDMIDDYILEPKEGIENASTETRAVSTI